MSFYQGKDLRKPSGGRIRPHRKKRKFELGRPPTETLLGKEEIRKVERVRGGNIKIRLKLSAFANVTDPETGKTQRVPIIRVKKNPANPDYSRRGVITKGAVIETPLGEAVITSRPGQEGIVNAVLVKGKK
ncbi:MAG: 30S ribosomal protein S8e [Candidatus Methanomethylicota archaeon]|uniref:Small ribosomal subunit protein eS8 n=1 Tax=Thermoproteota archaeon TaxID=2056631 RepID=A0A497F8G9_9CREN|nr:MAG: 30S ribosomal protein S8e [Candidatus Verstraetearchaeota archaeon]RLE55984.1 MAG: 30S ribosomal protein S8e [Candidatus Verstraetearchaeota archaeon]